jgi:hypothetical protein
MTSQSEGASFSKAGPSLDLKYPLLGLFLVRFGSIMAQPIEGLVGYGDFQHFFDLARFSQQLGGGLPFLGHWVEFPPLFPFLNLILFNLSGGRFHNYVYVLSILLALFDIGSLWMFGKLARAALPPGRQLVPVWLYAAFLALPAFGAWTFEPIAVFFMLSSLWLIIDGAPVLAGISAGLGALTKVFPILSLILAWRYWGPRRALWATFAALLMVGLAVVPLLLASPQYATASLKSQVSKASYGTVWALIDGNRRTGNFGPLDEYLDPTMASQLRGEPARVPLWITTLLGAVIGLWAFRRSEPGRLRSGLALLGLGWCVALLWMRGWSPQWLAYLAPLILLLVPAPRAIALLINLAIVSLLEWPLLLSRGFFDLQWAPILIRTVLLLLTGFEFARLMIAASSPKRIEV